jgi:imidazole glycerol-phosphate synthase subunit HisF
MITKRIIPCLDVTNGRVVKGVNFLFLKDAGDPVELAKTYDLQGADELVFLDITASSDKREILLDLVARTAEAIFIPFTVGGGISDTDTMRALLHAGADKVSVNSAAIRDPGLIQKASTLFGAQCVVVAIDAKALLPGEVVPDSPIPEVAVDSASGWQIYTHGGRKPTGIDAVKWAAYMAACGAGELLVTSMDRDGTKAGYDVALLSRISDVTTVPVIASGGAGAMSHIVDALHVADAALLASLLHFGEMTVSEIKTACHSDGLCMRL